MSILISAPFGDVCTSSYNQNSISQPQGNFLFFLYNIIILIIQKLNRTTPNHIKFIPMEPNAMFKEMFKNEIFMIMLMTMMIVIIIFIIIIMVNKKNNYNYNNIL